MSDPVPFEAEDQFEITGRGTVLCGPYPFEAGETAFGRVIIAKGRYWRVRGVERFAILRTLEKGEQVGLLVLAIAR